MRSRSVRLLETIDRSLDKGVVIDAWAGVPLLGCDVVSLDARMFVASFDAYLEHAESVGEAPDAAAPEPVAAVEQSDAQIQALPEPSQPGRGMSPKEQHDAGDSTQHEVAHGVR